MNLLLLEPAEVAGDRVVVEGRRAEHLTAVLGVDVGRTLRAGVLGGRLGTATVVALGAHQVTLELALTNDAPPPLPITLWLAIPRPKALSRVLQTVASIGIARVALTNAWRVDKSYLKSPRLDAAHLRADLLLGAEQGETTRLPEVSVHARLMELLDGPDAAHGQRVVAHARGGDTLERALPRGPLAPTVVAVGPEGGWIDRELDTFVARGFQVVTLGMPVLRTEIAVTAMLAQLMLIARL